MSQRALISVLILFCLNVGFLSAQVPTLNPTQTVNTATGEMGFSLPIFTLQGINGNTYPINLSYAAGIKYSQPSSAAGLGFSYTPGSISRKVIFAPDNNAENFGYANGTFNDCSAWWVELVQALVIVVGFVLAYISAGSSAPVTIGLITGALSLGLSLGSGAISKAIISSTDFNAGGTHVASYQAPKNGIGFFHGAPNDVPDIYFINTPFINGEFVWIGNKDDGHFVMTKTGGQSVKGSSTEIIKYDMAAEKFEIVLNDGTRLIFGKGVRATYDMFTWAKDHDNSTGVTCETVSDNVDVGLEPDEWLLTAILYPDYVDGNGDDNPYDDAESSNVGNWVTFGYLQPGSVQFGKRNVEVLMSGEKAITENYGPDFLEEYLPSTIRTPNQRAYFAWGTPYRQDERWYDDEGRRLGRNLLSLLTVRNNDGDVLYRGSFEYDYSLRKNHIHSMVKENDSWQCDNENPTGGALTLKKIRILALNSSGSTYLPDINFSYVANNPDGWDPRRRGSNYASSYYPKGNYFPEEKDLWGYYCYNPAFYNASTTDDNNDFNAYGSYERAVSADAWSLEQIELPSGMKIKWEYEPNRYKLANGETITAKDINGNDQSIKYGGGIRVKKVSVEDGLGSNKSYSYFYTNEAGNFSENNNLSSGHATAEPFNYISGLELRHELARGGYSTPTKILYEKTQVVENYSDIAPHAPNGYTVYEYYTSADFRNLGNYGEIDYNWARGFLKSKKVYNSKGNEIVSETTDYLFDEINVASNNVSYGIVRPVKGTTKQNGVTSVIDYEYDNYSGVITTTKQNNSDYSTLITKSIPAYTKYSLMDQDKHQLKQNCMQLVYKDVIDNQNVVSANATTYAYPNVQQAIHVPLGNPRPADNEPAYPLVCGKILLQWDAYAKSEINYTYDVYLGTSNPPPYVGTVSAVSQNNIGYQPESDLIANTDYYWKIVVKDQSSVLMDGNIWTFKSGTNNTVTNGCGSANGWIFVIPSMYGGPGGEKSAGQKINITWLADLSIVNNVSVFYLENGQWKEALGAFINYEVGGGKYRWGNVEWEIPISLAGKVTKIKVHSYYGSLGEVYDESEPISVTVPPRLKLQPSAHYVWKEYLKADGTPQNAITSFEFNNPSISDNWVLVDTITKYSNKLQILERALPNSKQGKTFESTIYGEKGLYPIASIINSKYDECGIFTCDYDKDDKGSIYKCVIINGQELCLWQDDYFFDMEKGWRKGDKHSAASIIELTSEKSHFGNQSIRIHDASAVMKDVVIRDKNKRTFSAWIYPLAEFVRFSAGLYVDGVLQEEKGFVYNATELNKWQLVQGDVDIADISNEIDGTNDYIKIWIGNQSTDAACNLYVDDIRFYPSNAHVNTFYNDDKWNKAQVVIDSNNKPGFGTDFDEFARGFRTYKIDYTKSRNENGFKTVISEKEYSFGRDN